MNTWSSLYLPDPTFDYPYIYLSPPLNKFWLSFWSHRNLTIVAPLQSMDLSAALIPVVWTTEGRCPTHILAKRASVGLRLSHMTVVTRNRHSSRTIPWQRLITTVVTRIPMSTQHRGVIPWIQTRDGNYAIFHHVMWQVSKQLCHIPPCDGAG